MRQRFISGLVLLVMLAATGWIEKPAAALTPGDPQQAVSASSQSSTTVTPTPVAARKPWYLNRTMKYVGGGAGGGALVGALVGGGKGAAIGAISGGAAGYIYDRKTRNKKK